jgi:hypothetical protein
MANWATEHLINFLLDLSAALGAAWLFFKYQPLFSDYRARRSTLTRMRKSDRLEGSLMQFEGVFGDVRLYLARLIVIEVQ